MARKCKCRAGKCGKCSRCKKCQCRCERRPEDMECTCHGVKCSKCGVCARHRCRCLVSAPRIRRPSAATVPDDSEHESDTTSSRAAKRRVGERRSVRVSQAATSDGVRRLDVPQPGAACAAWLTYVTAGLPPPVSRKRKRADTTWAALIADIGGASGRISPSNWASTGAKRKAVALFSNIFVQLLAVTMDDPGELAEGIAARIKKCGSVTATSRGVGFYCRRQSDCIWT